MAASPSLPSGGEPDPAMPHPPPRSRSFKVRGLGCLRFSADSPTSSARPTHTCSEYMSPQGTAALPRLGAAPSTHNLALGLSTHAGAGVSSVTPRAPAAASELCADLCSFRNTEHPSGPWLPRQELDRPAPGSGGQKPGHGGAQGTAGSPCQRGPRWPPCPSEGGHSPHPPKAPRMSPTEPEMAMPCSSDVTGEETGGQPPPH